MENEEIKQIVISVINELEYLKKKEEAEEKEFLKQKKIAFYSVVIGNVIQLRIQITNLLITISAAMVAALPYFYEKNSNKNLFIIILVLFASEIVIGLVMHELDSKQLLSLEKENDGKNAKNYTGITGILKYLMYGIFIFSVILLIYLSKNFSTL